MLALRRKYAVPGSEGLKGKLFSCRLNKIISVSIYFFIILVSSLILSCYISLVFLFIFPLCYFFVFPLSFIYILLVLLFIFSWYYYLYFLGIFLFISFSSYFLFIFCYFIFKILHSLEFNYYMEQFFPFFFSNFLVFDSMFSISNLII